MLAKVDRYWHTLRHLRPVQFYGRVWFRFAKPRLELARPPARRAPVGAWQLPARREASLVAPGEFLFLGEAGALVEVGWDGPQREKLWRYNQHYFDDLNAAGAPERDDWHRALLENWVRGNAPGHGNAWEPYPTSLRIVNWVKWALAGNALPAACEHSLAVQARWLMRRLEIHLLGNHLFANAKALVFAGLYFEGDEAQRWLECGLRILAREVPEQILPDGGHFERSTMYHALALEDMLDLCNVTTALADGLTARWQGLQDDWRARVPGMCAWLRAMCHPDQKQKTGSDPDFPDFHSHDSNGGEIAFFNDAAIGIAPAPAELLRYAGALGFVDGAPRTGPVTHLRDSGYVRVAQGPAIALLDVAPVGPDYLPGHAHADTLSFELSVFGQRVLVNSGTSCYGTSAERLRQRGTAAHNTVVVDGHDSSEVWAGFRVARRARPHGLRVEDDGAGSVRVACAHDGYRRLPGRPEHRREWVMSAGGLCVEDHVAGAFGSADARFHVHPDVVVEVGVGAQTSVGEGDHGGAGADAGAGVEGGEGVDAEAGCLHLRDGSRVRWRVERGSLRIMPATWHPHFGSSVPTSCLVLDLHDGASRIRFDWD